MRILLCNLDEIRAHNGVNSVALVHRQMLSVCNLLKWLVPRAGVEPARPYGQRILSPLKSVSPSLTKRYEPVFTGLAVVTYRFVWLRINPSRHHLSPIFHPAWKPVHRVVERASCR